MPSPSSASSLPTSKSPTAISRAAARARMRERAAANAAQLEAQKINVQEDPLGSGTDKKGSQMHSPHPSQPCHKSSTQHEIGPSAIHHLHASSDSSASTPILPHLEPTARTTRNTPRTPTAALPDSRETDRPLRIAPNADERSFAGSSMDQGGSAPPRIYARPKVRLYNRDDNDDAGQSSADNIVYEDRDDDAPYIPGRAAENNLRCLKWLRSVGKGGDSQ